MRSVNKNTVGFIVGPSGVGKTHLSIEIAEALNAEIISADSRYLYKGMDIGTAKPSRAELDRVRHHLVDVAEVNQPWSLALYKKTVLAIIKDIHNRRKFPLIVGGTGQYVRALIEGWDIPARPSSPALRAALSAWGGELGAQGLHERLSVLDAQAARNIDFRNVRRTLRALEVIFFTGEKYSAARKRQPIHFSYKIAGLTLPRELLYRRIDDRIDEMVAKGLVQEVQALMGKGYSLDDAPLSAIGYREIMLYLKEEQPMEESIAAIRKRTRQLVRRQANWFKENDPRIRWFDLRERDPQGHIIEYFKDEKGWLD